MQNVFTIYATLGMLNLQSNIKFLKGVGEKKATILLKDLEILTVNDLLNYFPFRYVDKTKFFTIREISPDMPNIQLKGQVTRAIEEGTGYKKRLKAYFTDGTGQMELVWFKNFSWVLKNLEYGTDYVIYGKPTRFRQMWQMAHPEMELAEKVDTRLNSSLESVYHTSEKMKQNSMTPKFIHNIMRNALEGVEEQIAETFPDYLRDLTGLISRKEAMLNIHFPKDQFLLKKATYRLKFEELFFFQLQLLLQKKMRTEKIAGHACPKVGYYFNDFYYKHLPFSLTGAQKKVIKEVYADIKMDRQMNRLLQGDVGSGKTLVAFMSMLLAIDNGYQACMMAPTEILAQQHYETLQEFAGKLGLRVGIWTGSTRKKQRNILSEALLKGEIHILIGTHALIEDTVKFMNLGFVVIDEQHRFGVAQRAKMWTKNHKPPHVLVMSATPIPRTLQMTAYADLDVSVIDELPPGRKSIVTQHRYDSHRPAVFQFMRDQIKEGRQVYVVYPLIKESEKMDYKDLEDGYESITRAFPGMCVSVLHGNMKQNDKDRSMQLFVTGQAHILVSTTVIEVGVNVPNASVMIIESAERFGLSQLHQLRGRVGRGASQSYCILMTSFKLSKDARTRIDTMVRTNDGFEIAEQDLLLRGPGDIDGTQQSGMPVDLKIANILRDADILKHARNTAIDIIEKDPTLEKPENGRLKQGLEDCKAMYKSWRKIS